MTPAPSRLALRSFPFLIGMAIALGPTNAASSDVDQLLSEIDDLWRGTSSFAIISMQIKTANYERTLRLEAWSRGKDRTLVRILEPLKEKGTATLKSSNNIYTYLPKTDRTIRLSSGLMMNSWMGSHFTNDDLVKESRLLDDYKATLIFEGEREGKSIVEIALDPKPDAAVVWGKIVLTVLMPDRVPLHHVYFDEDMNVVRQMFFSDLKSIRGRKTPMRLKVVPEHKPREFTELLYEKLEFDVDITDDFFSVSKLKRQ